MSSYILGAVLYFVIGYVLSLVVGFRVKAGDGRYVLLTMAVWPIVCLFVVAWAIEDVIAYLQRKR